MNTIDDKVTGQEFAAFSEFPDDYCITKVIAESQRQREISQGVGLVGTMGYQNLKFDADDKVLKPNCYTCVGKDVQCKIYEPNGQQW